MNWAKCKDTDGKLTVALVLLLAMSFAVLLPLFSGVPQSQLQPPSSIPGQSITLLSDGRWLLLGGESLGGGINTASIWNPRTGATTQLPARLKQARAWHSATMLPDGAVFIFGGIGSDRRVVEGAELFDPTSLTFAAVSTDGLSARAGHTATLLTDGQMLIAGGLGPKGEGLATADLWDSQENSTAPVSAFTTARRNHSATLMPDGGVLLWGGSDAKNIPLNGGEVFNPNSGTFTPVASYPSTIFSQPTDAPILETSLPTHQSVDVPTDSIISLRLSKPLKAETVNINTVTLSGPKGVETVKVVPAENGSLVFVTPVADLLPGATYTVTINGAVDRNGLLLSVSGMSFSTVPLPSGVNPTTGGGLQPGTLSDSDDSSRAGSDDSEWRGRRRDGKPRSDWEDLPPLKARPGITALAGQVLDLKGQPLARVVLKIGGGYGSGSKSAQTDETGRFLITNIDPGWREMIIDGREARRRLNGRSSDLGPREDHGVFEYGLKITEKETNVLPFTIWLPKIDTKYAVRIPSPTITEIVVTNPKIPGLELRLAPGTTITDHEGKTVREVSVTPIPFDRTPFPLPKNVVTPAYFTAQPGGSYVYSHSHIGARVIYPNNTIQPPGARFDFWHYDTEPKGWYIYGQGRVTDDGKQIVPDPGVSIYEFTGAMTNGGSPPPPGPRPCPKGKKCDDGDPVNLATGQFVTSKTDLYLPDVLPIEFTRVYVPGDTNSRPFGIGTTHNYAQFLWSNNQYQDVNLILPDGGRIYYVRISPGTSWADAVFEHTATQTEFYKSKIVWNGNGWDLTLKDGTVHVHGENAPLQAIRDRNGNQITITRATGQTGNITRISSSNGKFINFTYDGSNRITQATDHIGRVVTYTYDTSGRLSTVTDPNSGVSQYTYDDTVPGDAVRKTRMLTLKDARNIVFLTNEYDANGRIFKQTQADSGIYEFAYTLDGSGKVTQTDLTDPRGRVRRVTFNSEGEILTDTRALGTPEEQVTTYEVQAATNFSLSVTDPLNRKTSFTYDVMGNTLTKTQLADTGNAVTTTYTYEPMYNQVTSVTDPLSHTTNFAYDAKGNLISVTNALNQTIAIGRNFAGQVMSITDPLSHTTQFTYDFGDLATITDPVGNTTSRITDSAGRVLNVTNPLGNPTIYDYDVLNRLTQALDPLNGVTAFGYDANGNLLNVTDARSNQTVYTYEDMDRLATRVDPLTRTESYQYDLNGNMTQFTDRKSQATSYTYDGINRRTGVTYADSSTTTYTLDKGNRLTQVVDSIAGTITRTYDGLNRIASETTPQGSVSYTYDAAGRRTSMTVFGQTAVNYTYDNANRLTQITQGSATVTYTYDAAGRRTSLTLPNDVLVEYAYDNASRLTDITYKQNGTTLLGDLTYEYDKNGNRTKTGGSFARTGLPQAVASTVYNVANHQTTFDNKTLTYDNNGNLLTSTDPGGTTTYTWNARNQLTGISGPGVSATFVYDGLGRREKKTINSNVTEFLYDRLNPVQETSGATILANILPGLGIDEFLTRTDVVAGVTSSFLADALGSPVAVTDNTGVIQTEYTYEPFGKTTSTGASNSSSYQYTGRENDGTGLYYYRARFYNPQLQRFISEDPIEFYGGDINLFGYVENNPLIFVDHFGFEKCKTRNCEPPLPPPPPTCQRLSDCGPSPQRPVPQQPQKQMEEPETQRPGDVWDVIKEIQRHWREHCAKMPHTC